MHMRRVLTVFLALAAQPAAARNLCTMVADVAAGRVLVANGDCRTRVTPASTFKIPLAVMGFDSGVLTDAHAPTFPFKPGYVDWGGEAWKQPTDPTRWLKYSVVWYSGLVAHSLGQARVEDYARRFGFGNADLSGDPGRNNGLDRGWIMSSLKVSPAEQVAFLRRLVRGDLPVSAAAVNKAKSIVEVTAVGDWEAHGKTGAAFPRNPDGSFDEQHGIGWYVGWITRGASTYVFARLDQDDRADSVTPGVRARSAFLATWPTLVATLPTEHAVGAEAHPALQRMP
jgi:beta-lactamase class D